MEIDEQNIGNLVSLTAPQGDYDNSIVYINQISKVKYEGKLVLLVQGNFPNGCTELLRSSHKMVGDATLRINLEGWKPSDRMCTQALVPFSYIYDQLPPNEIRTLDTYLIDGRRYQF
jgi:hypothetical protein